MSDEVYWEKRAEYITNLQFDKTDNYIFDLDLEYKKALESIQKQINEIYSKCDITRIAYHAKLARLKELKAQINNVINPLYDKQQKDLTEFLGGVYKDTYYKNIFEIYKGLGIGINFVKVDNKAIQKILKEPWNDANYSDRIWNNKKLLVKELQSVLTQSFIRGDSIDKTSKIVANRVHVANGAARRLVNTESAYITSKATLDGYSNSGFLKQYEILATLDLHTSKICRHMDGKVFDLDKKEIGCNAPPFHPNCRSTTIPYFEDAIDEERIARDHKGNTYYVNGNTEYEDWYKEHVANNPDVLAEEKKNQNKSNDKKQHEKYKEVLGKEIPKSFEDFQDLKYNNTEIWNNLKNDFKIVNSYDTDFGYVSPQKILELDKLAFEAKRNNQISKYKTQGNFAILQYNNKVKFASSRIASSDDNEYIKYKGDKEQLVLLKEKRKFKTADLGDMVDGKENTVPRYYDTEAKFFEFLADTLDKENIKEIFMLSEKKMCESCRKVANQFIKTYPDVKVNVVSGRTFDGWKGR